MNSHSSVEISSDLDVENSDLEVRENGTLLVNGNATMKGMIFPLPLPTSPLFYFPFRFPLFAVFTVIYLSTLIILFSSFSSLFVVVLLFSRYE